MARVNISVPDELLQRARAAGLNISAAAAAGLTEELTRLEKIEAFDRYMGKLIEEEGPITEEEKAEAEAWAARAYVVNPRSRSTSA